MRKISRPPNRGARLHADRAGSAERPLRHDLVDAAVLEACGLALSQGWLADRALERVLRRERKLWASERRAASEATYGIIRWRGQLEWLLGAGRPAEMPLLYALWLVRSTGLAAEEAGRRLGIPPKALQAVAGAEGRIAAIADPVERLSVEESLPRWIAERFAAEMGLAEARVLARAMNTRAPLAVRVNLLRATRDELARRLAGEGVGAAATAHSPWGLVLDGHQNAFQLASFKEGWFEIQDEGSQLLALAVGARPGKRVVDACAGAGGKTLALAMEMRSKGELQALDSDADRLSEAKRRARRAGVSNLRIRAIPAGAGAEEALADLCGTADRVLVDAPCSGLGTLRRKPDARWRLQPGEPERFAALQRELAARFARLLKPGARMLYATCAIGRTENEEVARFVEEELGLRPAPLAEPLGAERAAALGITGHQMKLLPHLHFTDGFFGALFEKAK
ncbi:MAG: RsmB/NOP family class I SAM-dependent RNA methyltransferase [Deltaproteobacteria bacterium]|nr:RsmB/NOP family class I SAM-dependent RNA methyltransferase [Deltaproteobacteria bacterium]